jgi:hypothetical protein
MARPTLANSLENCVVKTFLIAGAVLGACLIVVGAGAVLGVALGTRSLVVSAASVKPAAVLSIAPTGYAGSRVLVATRSRGAN